MIRKHILVGAASARVGGVLAAEQGGIPHAAVVGLHVDLGPHAAGLTALRASFHFCPHLHVLLHGYEAERCSSVRLQKQAGGRVTQRLLRPGPTVVSAFGVDALLPLLFHLIRRRIVDVGLALSQQLLAKLQDDGKMVAGVGELVWTDLKHGNIFQNHLRGKKKVFSGYVSTISTLKAFVPTCLFLPSQSPPFLSQGWCHQSA